ncbi:MAG: glycosyltransferase family 1 protein [Pusillimonas sp.]|mgnify:CR=1 FL=1|nr:glycosyltransferase family 1 protein [Pusillimonas sp.]
MTRLRIAFSEAATSFGGQEQYIFKVMRGLRELGHEVQAVCQPHAKLAQQLQDDGFTVHTLLTDGFVNYTKGVLRLRRLFAEQKFDVVNTNSRRDTMLVGMAARLAGVPLVVRSRHLAKRVGSLLSYTVVPHKVIACSHYVRNHLIDRGAKPEKIKVVYPGIDLQNWPQGSSVRAELKLAENDVVIVCVAVMREQKGHRVLLQAVEPLIRARPNVHLVLVGSGSPLMETLQGIVAEKGLARRVHFLGMRQDVPQILNGSDIFALATETEAAGMVFAEAQASGLPVVGTRVGGVPEMMVENETGILFELRDVNALKTALQKLVDDPGLRRKMGTAGRQFVHDAHRFDLTSMAKSTEQAYLDWLGQRNWKKS